MIATTYSGTSVLILNERPDWSGRIRLNLEALTQWDESLTNREGRRPHAATLRGRLRYTITLSGTEAQALSAQLRTYQTTPVLVPLWPMDRAWSSRSEIATSGGLRLAYVADFSAWELYTSTEPIWPTAEDRTVPLLWCRLDSRDVRWVSAEVAEFDVDAVETGPADLALQPSAVSFSAGPGLSGYATAPRLWPLPLDWATVPETFQVRILREQLGFGRGQLETLYPQTSTRAAEFRTMAATVSQVWSVLRFFSDHAAGGTFWSPTWRNAAVMAADLAGASTSLSVVNVAGIAAGDFLAFVQGTGTAATARVSSISGTTVTLATAPGAFTASQTVVAPLILARFERPRLEIEWLNAEVAAARFSVVEVPPEYAPASDETLGTTIGLLPVRAYVYDFDQVLGGTTYTTRATSYERTLTVSGNTYTARRMDHGAIKSGLFLDRNEVEIRTEILPGDILAAVATAQSETPVRVTIRSVDVSGSTGSNAAVLFTGEILSAQVRGSRITARAVTAGAVFDRLFPRLRMQVGCNHALFSVGCGLASTDWKFTATVTNPGSAGYPYTFDLGSLARVSGTMPTVSAGWFAGGWAEFGSGSSLVRRAILDNTAASGGALTITLGKDPTPFPIVGASVALFPGCNGDRLTCSGKFANYANFGGHPFLPPSNPSLVRMSQNLGGGKK